MTKPELLKKLAAKADIAIPEADSCIEALIEILTENVLDAGEEVRINGLGVFKQKLTSARTGRNPKTGEAVEIKAKKSLTFKPASDMIRK